MINYEVHHFLQNSQCALHSSINIMKLNGLPHSLVCQQASFLDRVIFTRKHVACADNHNFLDFLIVTTIPKSLFHETGCMDFQRIGQCRSVVLPWHLEAFFYVLRAVTDKIIGFFSVPSHIIIAITLDGLPNKKFICTFFRFVIKTFRNCAFGKFLFTIFSN